MNTVKLFGIVLALVLAAMLPLSACGASPAGASASPSPAATPSPASAPETPAPEPTPAETPAPAPTAEPTPSPAATPVVHPDGPGVIGLYLRRGSHEELLTAYDKKWVRGQDIATFHAYATNEKTVKGTIKDIFTKRWNAFENAENFKVGYVLSFTLKSSETVTLTIRGPEDAPKDPAKRFYQYVEVYMYDAVHQTGRHSHLTKLDVNTFLTSIKLTAGKKIEDVRSIRLTAFVYKDDGDFDPVTGEYVGNVSYTIPVNRIS